MNKLTKKGNIYTWGNATYATVMHNFRGATRDFAGLEAALKAIGIDPDAKDETVFWQDLAAAVKAKDLEAVTRIIGEAETEEYGNAFALKFLNLG